MIIVYASVWFTEATPLPQDYRQIWENPYANLKFLLFPFGYFIPRRAGRAARRRPLRHGDAADARADARGAAAGLRAHGVGEGAAERSVVVGHAMKNALIPVVTVIGLQVPIVVGGSVIVESIYNVPGMGQWFFQSIGFRDYTVVQTIALIAAVAVVLSNLVVDITYAYLDPRIRYS